MRLKRHIDLHIVALIWCAVTVVPLIFTVLSSFKTTIQIYQNPFSLPESVDWFNFTTAIEKGSILSAIGNSFFLALATVVFVVLIASMAAFIVARNDGKIYKFIYILLLAGILIPVHATFIPLVRMVSSINGTNNYLVMIMIYTAMNLPLPFLLICSYMKRMNKDIEEAAIVDGCSEFRLYSKIVMPISKPIIATVSIITFLSVYNDLVFSLLFINDKKMYTISLALNMFKQQYTKDYGATFAAIVLALVPLMIIYFLLQKQIIKGMTAGAVKE